MELEQFIQNYPGVAVAAMYGLLLLVVGIVTFGFKKLVGMMAFQNATLARIDRRGIRHSARIRALEFHAWGREPAAHTEEDDET